MTTRPAGREGPRRTGRRPPLTILQQVVGKLDGQIRFVAFRGRWAVERAILLDQPLPILFEVKDA